jgi:hypothetical protein
VLDGSRTVASLYGPSGHFAGTVDVLAGRASQRTDSTPITPIELLPDRRFLVAYQLTTEDLLNDPAGTIVVAKPGEDLTRSNACELGRIGARNTFLALSVPEGSVLFSSTSLLGMLSRGPFWTLASDRSSSLSVWDDLDDAQDSVTVYLAKRSLQCDTLFQKRLRFPSRPLDKRLVDSIAGVIANVIQTLRPSAAVDSILVLDGLAAPRLTPPVTAVLAASDGGAWLRGEFGRSYNIKWMVIDRNGNYVDDLYLPRALNVYAVERHGVWGVCQRSGKVVAIHYNTFLRSGESSSRPAEEGKAQPGPAGCV